MLVKKVSNKDSELIFKVSLDADELAKIKNHVVQDLSGQVKIAGFRAGHAPAGLVEKNLDEQKLQNEVLEHAINNYYPKAIEELKERPLSNPQIAITKFVPFTALEFAATVATAGQIKLANYKTMSVKREEPKVTDAEIDDVIKSLQKRFATKNDVERAAKDGDQVWIDFSGTDSKGEPIKGGSGKEYPLLLGSKTFIPGFEENLVGLKKGDEKSFKVTFPKDYGAKNLAGKEAGFKVKVNKVQEVGEPNVDDAFAAQAGPFKTLADLKADIKKQLLHEKQMQAHRKQEGQLVEKIVAKSTVTAPKQLVESQIENELARLKQNLAYRGQTYEEFLEQQGLTDEQYREKELKPVAVERVKAALVLSEIAYKEDIRVSKDELDAHIATLKTQYNDPNMQAQLDDPNNRSDIASRLLTEKTLHKLVNLKSKK